MPSLILWCIASREWINELHDGTRLLGEQYYFCFPFSHTHRNCYNWLLALSIFLCLSLGRVAETTHWLFKHSLGNYAQSSIVFKFLLLSLSLAFSSTDINYLSHHCPLQRPSLSLALSLSHTHSHTHTHKWHQRMMELQKK